MLPSDSRVLFSFYFLIENRQNSKSSENSKCFRIPQILKVLWFKSPLSSRSKWGTVLYSKFISLVFVSVYMCYCMWNLFSVLLFFSHFLFAQLCFLLCSDLTVWKFCLAYYLVWKWQISCHHLRNMDYLDPCCFMFCHALHTSFNC